MINLKKKYETKILKTPAGKALGPDSVLFVIFWSAELVIPAALSPLKLLYVCTDSMYLFSIHCVCVLLSIRMREQDKTFNGES